MSIFWNIVDFMEYQVSNIRYFFSFLDVLLFLEKNKVIFSFSQKNRHGVGMSKKVSICKFLFSVMHTLSDVSTHSYIETFSNFIIQNMKRLSQINFVILWTFVYIQIFGSGQASGEIHELFKVKPISTL